jgi:hypothetical protein
VSLARRRFVKTRLANHRLLGMDAHGIRFRMRAATPTS